MLGQTLADRGRSRDRAILQTLVAGGGLQLTIVLSAILSLPVVTRDLTSSEYGVLATLTGFVALLAFADLGVGGALTTRLAAVLGRDDQDEAAVVVSTAVVASLMASGLLLAVGILATFVLPWQTILGASEVRESAVTSAVLCTALATGMSIVGGIGQRILYGVQRGRVANQWLVAAAVFSALASVLAALMHAPLFVFVLAAVGCPSLVSLGCTAWVLARTPEVPRPSWLAVRKEEFFELAGSSWWFFLIALFSAIGYQTDALIVASVLGASAAGVFSVASRVFGVVLQSLYPALLQLWPAFGEAYARGDLSWMRSRLRWSVSLVALVSAASGIALILVGRDLISVWLTDDLVPSRGLLVALAVWTAYSLAMAPVLLLLNATGRVRAHALMAIGVGVANLPLSVLFTLQFGTMGPVLGSLVANVLFAGLPGVVIAKRVLSGGTPRDSRPGQPVQDVR